MPGNADAQFDVPMSARFIGRKATRRNPPVIDTIHLPIVLSAALVATASSGPAMLAITDTSMRQGCSFGLALAAGSLM
jgi:hypothetical protein